MKTANLVIYDVGSTYTKVAAYLFQDETLVLVARGQVPTNVEDIYTGIEEANDALVDLGCQLSSDCMRFATSSAAGGLRMVAMGYMPRVTAKAAKEVSMNAGARVLEIVTHEDPPDYRLEILQEIRPDIILLAGGTDGGDRDNIIENARLILQARIDAVVIVAGNMAAQPEVEEILREGGVAYKRVANVMPTIHELKIQGARLAIHEEFIRQISFGKGLQRLVDIVTEKTVMPTPGAVLLAADLLASGTHEEEGVGDLMLIDLGGATTDIHSILPSLEELRPEEKGLVVTNEKQTSYRTVEGNLGMRVSATGIVAAVGPKQVLRHLGDAQITEEDFLAYVTMLERQPGHICGTEQEKAMDRALAICAMEVALKRHAGCIAQEYDPVMGVTPGTPMGRDLRAVKTIIAVGGIFVHGEEGTGEQLVREALSNPGISLLPRDFSVYCDRSYLLYGIGALSQKAPDSALRFMKDYLKIKH